MVRDGVVGEQALLGRLVLLESLRKCSLVESHIVKCIGAVHRPLQGEKWMILQIVANVRKIDNWFNILGLEGFRIPDPR